MRLQNYHAFVALAFAVTVSAREPLAGLHDLLDLEEKVAAVAAQAMPVTVALIAEATGASGSGVLVSADGLILTASHVIQGGEKVLVVFPDGRQVPGESLGANYTRDSAMVRVCGEGAPWPHVKLGTSRALKAGDWVVGLGHSAGFDTARTPPVRFGRVVSRGPGNFLTTDCTLIAGDSGGPLFDLEGRLVAIHSSIGQSLQNNSHAGIDGFVEDWARLLEGDSWGRLSLNPFTNPDMPVLGISMGRQRGGGRGVPVVKIVPRSPAAAAGVRIGDAIVALDNQEIRNSSQLLQALAKRNVGETVRLHVARDRGESNIDVVLSRREELYDE
jgi:serine protease Do